ncbi:MAG TPA: nucleotidyltransferase family protein [Gemmatimonadaceae bacterium]|nr:nucleotidyltransferase family protein [Gemmatimonadaceae bacterium]
MVRRIDKAIVLAAGRGTRMRAPTGATLTADQAAAADAGAKPLIPVGSARPFLDYSLSALADGGFVRVCLVVAPGDAAIRDRYSSELRLERLEIAFAEQAAARGTADALLAARDFAGDDEFLVLNADNYYPVAGLEWLRDSGEPATLAFARDGLLRSGQIEADRLARYALLDVGADGYLRDVVEKPDAELARAHSALPISMNVWRFDSAIFEACRSVPLSPRGELELPTAVQHGVRAGALRIRALPIDAAVLDLSHRADIPAVDAALRSMTVCL